MDNTTHEDIGVINRYQIHGEYIDAIASAIRMFRETHQDVRNFDVYIYDDANNKQYVKISFSPRQVPGKKVLGGKTEFGYGVVYIVDQKTGEVIRTLLSR